MFGCEALDRLFDSVEPSNAVKRLLGDRRTSGGMDLEEFAPDMGPTAGLDNTVAGKQLVEAGIAVGMNDAGKPVEMGARMLAFAVG